jgi:diphosphomevalonate decarboxylase
MSSILSATAIAHPNIAFIKYWGNLDESLHLPANGSISMCLDGLTTRTSVSFDPNLSQDILTLDGQTMQGEALTRVSAFLDRVRHLTGIIIYAQVTSENNFPSGAGIASSASAFAALALAATSALGLDRSESALSSLARLGSGSACRSIPTGFVEWLPGTCHEDSYAFSLAPPEHWDLLDCIAIVDRSHKLTGSAQGMALAHTSPLQAERIKSAPGRLDRCRQAILERDFETFADAVEQDSDLMHAVMHTSIPPLAYMQPATYQIIATVRDWRKQGHRVCTTVDAGPNVHIICLADEQDFVQRSLLNLGGVNEVLIAKPGSGANLIV